MKMVDHYGVWHEESDYTNYPEEKWCMYDYMANAIRKTGYKVKTDMEHLISMIFLHAESEVENGEEIDLENVSDVMNYVMDSGGLKEFDYVC